MTTIAPVDPRLSQDVESLGTLPKLADMGADVFRLLAPNPSPMTLDGTNTYVIADRSSGTALIVDPGPPIAAHLDDVTELLASRGLEVSRIILTHHHLDHSEAAPMWSRRFGVGVSAARRDFVYGGGEILGDEQVIELGRRRLRMIATPGHASDHLALEVDERLLLTGDHVLGRSTSVVAYPDGDIEKYLESLVRTRELGRRILLPGHGPEISRELSSEVLDYYLAHRRYRLDQIVSQLEVKGAVTLDELVEKIYSMDATSPLFHPAAQSTRAALSYLNGSGLIRIGPEGFFELV